MLEKYFSLFKWMHLIAIGIFLCSITIKLILLLTNKEQALDALRAKTKPYEKYLGPIMIASGLCMIPAWTQAYAWLIVKLIFVAISVPLAIVGLNKKNKMLSSFAWIGFVFAFFVAQTKQVPFYNSNTEVTYVAPLVYSQNCQSCHGATGKEGVFDLSKSTLSADEFKYVVKSGRGAMPAFDSISDEDIEALRQFVSNK